jgi:alpha-tubulin suppressor-like RCC1 family protein
MSPRDSLNDLTALSKQPDVMEHQARLGRGSRQNGLRRLGRQAAAVSALGITLAAVAVAPASASTQLIRPFPTVHVGAAWGDNNYGQFGNGGPSSDTYTDVTQLQNLQQLSVGQTHTLGLTSDGNVWAWGNNGSGQLGTGTTVNWSDPRLVAGLSGVVQVAAGWDHSLALRSDGTVWAWGDNTAGELGDGTSTQRLAPVQVAGLTGVTQIAAGNEWSLALRSDGTVWGWGGNQWGQLGVAAPTAIALPRQISGLSHVTSIAAGAFFGLAVARRSTITTQNEVLAWGQDAVGQLGNGTACLCGYLIPTVVSGINAPLISSIAAGPESAFALGSDGSVWGWGGNAQHQISLARTGSYGHPDEILGTNSGVTQIASGAGHTLALLSDGTVEAWGYNAEGQLGDGSTAPDTQGPVKVTGLSGVTQITAGGDVSLAVRTTLRIFRL